MESVSFLGGGGFFGGVLLGCGCFIFKHASLPSPIEQFRSKQWSGMAQCL